MAINWDWYDIFLGPPAPPPAPAPEPPPFMGPVYYPPDPEPEEEYEPPPPVAPPLVIGPPPTRPPIPPPSTPAPVYSAPVTLQPPPPPVLDFGTPSIPAPPPAPVAVTTIDLGNPSAPPIVTMEVVPTLDIGTYQAVMNQPVLVSTAPPPPEEEYEPPRPPSPVAVSGPAIPPPPPTSPPPPPVITDAPQLPPPNQPTAMPWTPSTALAYIGSNGLTDSFYSRYPNAYGATHAGTWAVLWLEGNNVLPPGAISWEGNASNVDVRAAIAEEERISQAKNYSMPFVPVATAAPVFPTAAPPPTPPVAPAPLDIISATVQSTGVPGVAPTASWVQIPSQVFAGEDIFLMFRADDVNSDLGFMSVRQQGKGLVYSEDLSNWGYNEAQRWAEITAPQTGPILLRIEVVDRAGNSFTGPWQTIKVISQDAPEDSDISPWVKLKPVESSPGVHSFSLDVSANAPTLILQALAEAQAFLRGSGAEMNYAPQAFYALVADKFREIVARVIVSGKTVVNGEITNYGAGPFISPPSTPDPNPTVVAYEGQNPVYQQVMGSGDVKQWTQTPTGQTNVILVDNLGVYDNTLVAPPPAPQIADPVVPAGGGAPVPLPYGSPGGPISPDFDPNHTLVGYDNQGRRVYRLVDEGGNVIQWSVDASGAQIQTTIQNLGPKATAPVYVSSGPTNGTVAAAAAAKLSPWLWVAGAAAIGFALSRRNRRK